MKPRYRSAVALDYSAESGMAPVVTSKGELLNADQIVRIAQSLGVPVVEQGGLARSLTHLEVDQEIPPELYEAVALILAELENKGAK